ncbi:MFS transporter [Deinococcus sp.]|uniref:MFS transporter n=1 Tax=Deinococcus sp. TaxID=47478 RepID=UPI0025E7342B|nr:MFS transporter [Deinococcus sp.]
MLGRLRRRILEKMPFQPGSLGTVLSMAAALACAEFVRSGVYGAYLPQAGPELLGVPLTAVGAAWTAHFAADTLMRGVSGALISRYGLRRMVLLGAVLSLAALSCLPIAHSVWALIALSAVHGAAFSVIWPATMSLSAAKAREGYQGRAVSTVSVAVMPMVGAGFLLFGALARRTAQAGVPVPLLLALGVLSLGAACSLRLPARLAPAAKPEPQGAPSESGTGVSGDRAAAAAQGGTVARALRAARALAPLLPAAFIQNVSLSLLGPLLFTLAPLLQLEYWGVVALLLVGGAAAAAGLPFMGRLADRGRPRLILTLGFGLVGTALGLIATLPPLWALLGLSALLGLGYACILPGWAALVTATLPAEQRAAAWGTLMTAENAGTALGPLLGTLAFAQMGVRGPFLVGAVLALGTGLAYLLTRQSTAPKQAAAS